jgi:hypothetical protein
MEEGIVLEPFDNGPKWRHFNMEMIVRSSDRLHEACQPEAYSRPPFRSGVNYHRARGMKATVYLGYQ